MRIHAICGLIAIALLMAACGANFESIGRRTPLPSSTDGGIAVHLDAQQRLVVYRAKKYCAEPSPDALAAYAQSIGLGMGDSNQSALSLAAASQSTLASIGLRTQSITIMRDALYRMCEAYNNGALGDVMAATLLHRSQDLTSVILAVEQLTGAVAANQVIVTGTARANTSANLVANNRALASAQELVKKREQAVEEATQHLNASTNELRIAKTNVETAQRERDGGEGQEIGSAQSGINRAEQEFQVAEENHRRAKADLQTKQDQLENAKQVVEIIEAEQDAVLTSASATTTGAGQFTIVQPRTNLSPEATREIANAVHGLVTKALDKSYTVESCMALLTSGIDNADARERLEPVINLCIDLVTTGIQKALTIESTFDDSGTDPTIELLERAIEEDENLLSDIIRWMDNKDIKASPNNLLLDKEYSYRRRQIIEDLGIRGVQTVGQEQEQQDKEAVPESESQTEGRPKKEETENG